MIDGIIPKQITYVSGPQTLMEIDLGADETTDKQEKQLVSPTFVSTTDKTLITARKWIGHKRIREYNPETREYYHDHSPVLELTVDNKPIDNIRIIGLERRGNGGRAYKILIDDLYLVDLREDVLMDTMNQHGIDPGRKLKGRYIWAKIGSQTKLIMVEGEVEKELQKTTEIKEKQQEIESKDLVVGGIYKMKSKAMIFFGYDIVSKQNAFVEIYGFITKRAKTYEQAALEMLEPSRSRLYGTGWNDVTYYDSYTNFKFRKTTVKMLEKLGQLTPEELNRDQYFELLKQSIKIQCDTNQKQYSTQVPEDYYISYYKQTMKAVFV
jgi:hypothetical protein